MKRKAFTPTCFLLALALTALLSSCSKPESDFKKAEQTNTEQAFNEFIKKHPASPLVADAKTRIENKAYEKAYRARTVSAFEDFLGRFQGGQLAPLARIELEAAELAEANRGASKGNWEEFLRKYPQSTNCWQARQELARLVFQEIAISNNVAVYENFVKEYAGTEATKEALRRIESLDYLYATNANNIADYEHFLAKYPGSRLCIDVKNRLEPQLEDRDWNRALLANDREGYIAYFDKHQASSHVKRISGTISTKVAREIGLPSLGTQLIAAEGTGPVYGEKDHMFAICAIDSIPDFNEIIPAVHAARLGLITYTLGEKAISRTSGLFGQVSEREIELATAQAHDPLTNATMVFITTQRGDSSRPSYHVLKIVPAVK